MASQHWATAPNILTLARLLAVPVLVALALSGRAELFLVLLAAALATDAADGFIARRFNLASELGAKLDSWADLAVYMVMVLALWALWPSHFAREQFYIGLAVVATPLPIVFSWVKFGSYPSYHTRLAKWVALLLVPSYFALCLGLAELPFRVVIVLYTLVAAEELAITALLERPTTNVGSLWVLLRP